MAEVPLTSDSLIGTGTVATRLARIKSKLGRFEHTREVAGYGGYPYTPTDDIKDTLRPLLAAEGVSIVPVDVTVLDRQRYEVQKSNRKGPYTQVTYDLLIKVDWRISAGSDNCETAASLGRSLNTADKDPGAAHTYAYRNLVAALFDISTGENFEQEGHEAAEEARGEHEERPARRRREPEAEADQEPAEEEAPAEPKRSTRRKQTGDGDKPTPADRSRRRSSDTATGLISAAQLKRLQAIATKSSWPDPAMRRLFQALGGGKTEEGKYSAKLIPALIYEDICTALEESYPPLHEVQYELDQIRSGVGMSVPDFNDLLKPVMAEVVGEGTTLNDVVGSVDLFERVLAGIRDAYDATAHQAIPVGEGAAE